MEKEYRYIDNQQLRAVDNNTIEGYALTFNQQYLVRTQKGTFYEQIDKEALTGVIERSDIFCPLNHNMERGVLARSKYGQGSLNLTVDSVGLKYSFQRGKSPLHQELTEYLERGEIDKSSFVFTIAKDGERIEKRTNDYNLRTITQIDQLFDVSPVFQPCNNATTVNKRSLDNIFSENETTEIDPEAEKRELEFKKYWEKLKKKYN
jgi:uncharacterized protein